MSNASTFKSAQVGASGVYVAKKEVEVMSDVEKP
jgi:hypothetical protein